MHYYLVGHMAAVHNQAADHKLAADHNLVADHNHPAKTDMSHVISHNYNKYEFTVDRKLAYTADALISLTRWQQFA